MFTRSLDIPVRAFKALVFPFARRLNWSETRLILVVAVAIGILGGLGAVAFRKLIDILKELFFGSGENLIEVAFALPWWQRIVIPVTGGLLLAPFIRYFSKETKGHGVPEVMEGLVVRGGKIRPRTMFTRAFASAISIASGGSVGREGPIVQIGSALGSTVGQILKASEGRMKTLVGCGAAAGMAATFNAPLGGALFAVEVILGDFGLAQVPPIIISSVAATAVSRHFLGDFPAFEFHPPPLISHFEYLFYAFLGICTGLLAWLFVTVLYGSEDLFERIRLPVWLKPALGGLIVGLIAVWFPYIYGSGYETIDLALHDKLPLLILLALVFIKLFATSVTIASGGSGGVFAPALFQGAMLGSFAGLLFNMLFPGQITAAGLYSLLGMGGMIAGTMHAPITVVLVIFELTGDYKVILPVMTCSMLSTLMAYKLLKGQSIYTRKLIRRGINIYRGRDLNVLRGLKVGDVLIRDLAKVTESTPLNTLIPMALSNPHSCFIQVDELGKMTGVIPLQNILEVMRDENLRDILVAQDVASFDFPVLKVDESLDEVVRKLGESDIEEVPVIDPLSPEVPIGVLRHNDVLRAYRKAVIKHDLGGFVADRLVRDPGRQDVDLLDGYRMVETEAPGRFYGKSIRELGISETYGVQVILIRKSVSQAEPSGSKRKELHFVPKGADIIDPGDRLVLVGKSEDLQKLINP